MIPIEVQLHVVARLNGRVGCSITGLECVRACYHGFCYGLWVNFRGLNRFARLMMRGFLNVVKFSPERFDVALLDERALVSE